jgi:hypothetical protein
VIGENGEKRESFMAAHHRHMEQMVAASRWFRGASPRPDYIPSVGFFFDQREHRFWLNAVEMPGVTRILQSVGIVDYSHLPHGPGPESRGSYLARGQAVHAALAQIITGRFDYQYYERMPHWAGFIKSGEAWLQLARPEVLAVEQPVYNTDLWYAGVLDLILRFQGRLCVPDWKNNKAQRAARIQTKLYELAIPSLGQLVRYRYADQPHARLAIELSPTGKAGRAVWYDSHDLADLQIAEAAVAIYHWPRNRS